MMVRGEFIRGDGLVIPNNVTVAGKGMLLNAALRNVAPTFFFGLVDAEPAPVVSYEGIEPSAAGGYARIGVTRDAAGWPTFGTLENQPWLETDWLIWTAVGVKFDRKVRRIALMDTAAGAATIWALSAAMPEDLEVTPDLDVQYRRFKYRLYGA